MNNRIYLSPPHMTGREQEYIKEAFDSNWIAPLGPNVEQFEHDVANYVGSNGAVALSSGTAAIHLALKLLNIEEGDIVFCSSLTFIASANPILYEKAIPVFIDSDKTTWNMSPEALSRAFEKYKEIGKLPKAVIVVNLYGQSADYDKICDICDKYNVPIIEDAAESLGATYNDKMSGSIGKFGIFSFNGNKIITTSGGGMLVSNDKEALEKARFYATQARDNALHYQHSEIGYNYRLSNVLAGMGIAQLHSLEEKVRSRREIFNRYFDAFGSIDGISFMPEASYGRHTRWLTTLIIDEKKTGVNSRSIIQTLSDNNIEARPVWKPLHLQPLMKDYDFFSHHSEKAVSEELFEQGICIPSGSSLKASEQEKIIELIREAFQTVKQI